MVILKNLKRRKRRRISRVWMCHKKVSLSSGYYASFVEM
jgi:hypothetical protein